MESPDRRAALIHSYPISPPSRRLASKTPHMSQRPRPASAPELVALPVVHLGRDFLPAVIAANLRSGAWRRIARGAYIPHLDDEPVYAARRRLALARIVAVAALGGPHQWISHTSAGLLWNLPTYGSLAQTHIIHAAKPSTSGTSATGLVRHKTYLPIEHHTLHQGIAVTTLARTVVDCARFASPETALIIADAALNRHIDRSSINKVLFEVGVRPGSARARELLALADAGAESAGETLLRITLLQAGLPTPETQIEITTRIGTFWADLGWAKWRLLLEYDGRSKYQAQEPDAFIREKRRHDAIVEAGFMLLRITKEDLAAPTALARRIRSYLPPNAPELSTPKPLKR